jgi:hypothetical protein
VSGRAEAEVLVIMDRTEGDSAASPGYGNRGEEVLRSEKLSDTTRGFSRVAGGPLYQFLSCALGW